MCLVHPLFFHQKASLLRVCLAGLLLAGLHLPGAAQPNAAGTSPSSRISKVLLIGEKPAAGENRGPEAASALTSAATVALKAPVVDLTSPGATLEQTQKNASQYVAQKPDVVVLFAGAAEEAARIPSDRMQYSLQSLSRTLTETGARVFVLPSSTALGAEAAANLRIAASGAGAGTEFVELGGELSGRPYETALEEVARLLEKPAPVTVPPSPTPTPKPEPSPAGPTPALTLPPEPTPTPASPGTTSTKAGVEEPEEEKKPLLPPALAKRPADEKGKEKPSDQKQQDARTPQVTSTTIQMKAPVPVKQFNPRRPARTRNLDKKDPSFAR